MPKKDFDKENLVKASASHRSRAARGGARQNMPRVMIVGLLVVVAGGAALFWPRGGSLPTGIGERQTVVSAPDSTAADHTPPHSGDVDINAAASPALTPEKPTGERDSVQPADTPASQEARASTPESKPVTTTETKTETVKTPVQTPVQKPQTTRPAPQPVKAIVPASSGNYVVQVGAFGNAENADTEAARLKARGWDTRVRANNNANGDMIFQVHIAYFANRAEAEAFIQQNRKQLPGAFAKHK